MNTWPVQEAKARFSELLRASLSEGPQIVSYRGADAAVLVPMDEWRRLQSQSRLGIKSLLLSKAPQSDEFEVPDRGHLRRRKPAITER